MYSSCSTRRTVLKACSTMDYTTHMPRRVPCKITVAFNRAREPTRSQNVNFDRGKAADTTERHLLARTSKATLASRTYASYRPLETPTPGNTTAAQPAQLERLGIVNISE